MAINEKVEYLPLCVILRNSTEGNSRKLTYFEDIRHGIGMRQDRYLSMRELWNTHEVCFANVSRNRQLNVQAF